MPSMQTIYHAYGGVLSYTPVRAKEKIIQEHLQDHAREMRHEIGEFMEAEAVHNRQKNLVTLPSGKVMETG